MVKITYLGDSITFGQYVDPSVCWPSLITARLGESAITRNEGVNGEQTRQALERFPRVVQSSPPEILTIQYGLNDCNCWQTDKGVHRVSPLAFRANLTEMVERAKTFRIRRVILLTNHPTLRCTTMGNGQEYEEANRRYVHIIRAVAGKGPRWLVHLCDTYSTFSQVDLKPLLLSDGLHLSPAGHALYAETVWPFINTYWEDWHERNNS